MIAGHRHRYSLTAAGSEQGNDYPIVVVGQGQFATIDATRTEVRVTVLGNDGRRVGGVTVTRRPTGSVPGARKQAPFLP